MLIRNGLVSKKRWKKPKDANGYKICSKKWISDCVLPNWIWYNDPCWNGYQLVFILWTPAKMIQLVSWSKWILDPGLLSKCDKKSRKKINENQKMWKNIKRPPKNLKSEKNQKIWKRVKNRNSKKPKNSNGYQIYSL